MNAYNKQQAKERQVRKKRLQGMIKRGWTVKMLAREYSVTTQAIYKALRK